ncbi:hypothetical protein CRUP_000702 [Coryphaenoides rupestris]|nr:hypothetical protein CRUP_000702 [Coryphaenoides rupestris]
MRSRSVVIGRRVLSPQGFPTTIIAAWVLTRHFYDDHGCWDDTDVAFIWWIIKGPITASLLVPPDEEEEEELSRDELSCDELSCDMMSSDTTSWCHVIRRHDVM